METIYLNIMLTLIRVQLFILVISEFILSSCATSKNLGREFDDLYYSDNNPTKSLNAEDKRETDINNIEVKEVPPKRLVVDDSLKRINIKNKNYLGLFAGGLTGFIGNKSINFIRGYGGTIGYRFFGGFVFEGMMMSYKGVLPTIKGLPESTDIEIFTIGVNMDLFLVPPEAPIHPYFQLGFNDVQIDLENKGSFSGWSCGEFIFGTGVDIWLGRFLSINVEGSYGLNLIFSDDVLNNLKDIHKSLRNFFIVRGGVRLMIPIKAKSY